MSVECSPVAILRIAKHCLTGSSAVVSGCLLGLDNDKGEVEVTNVFVHPSKGAADFQVQQDDDQAAPAGDVSAASAYQTEAVKLLKAANVDSNIVGWFVSSTFSSFVTETSVEIQFDYQTQNSNSVLLVCDSAVETGKCPVKAYRLTKEYMDFHKAMRDRKNQGPATLITGGPVAFRTGAMTVFEEVPVSVKLSVLEEAFVFEHRGQAKDASTTATGRMTGTAVQQLVETVEDLAIEKVRFQQLSQGKAPVTTATRIRGEDETKRLQSANDLILLTENVVRLSAHVEAAANKATHLCALYESAASK